MLRGEGVRVNLTAVAAVVTVWALVAVLVPAIFYFGYGAENWARRSANKAKCELCDCMSQDGCWDGRTKGSFPTRGYKSVWFNLDLGTAFILLDVLVYSTLAMETVKKVIGAWPGIWYNAAGGLALLLYPNFYSFWCIYTYINDRNWVLLDNQLFFGVTEAMTAWMCVYLLDSSRPMHQHNRACGIASGIAASHLTLALMDQVRGGYLVVAPLAHQRLRDVFLLAPEVLLLALLCRRQTFKLVGQVVAVVVPAALILFWIEPVRWFLTAIGN